MPALKPEDFKVLYDNFDSPVSRLDCGKKCAPYNHGTPFCCTSEQAIPVVFIQEWQYLQARTDLWHPFKTTTAHDRKIKDELPWNNKLVECKGVQFCERENRSIACRSFPFFPYIDSNDEFIGLSYYWNFEDRCWVVSNLHVVEPNYVQEFVRAYDFILARVPNEREGFREHSIAMRRVFSRWRRTIPLLHRDGGHFKVSPKTGKMRQVDPHSFPKFTPYKQDD